MFDELNLASPKFRKFALAWTLRLPFGRRLHGFLQFFPGLVPFGFVSAAESKTLIGGQSIYLRADVQWENQADDEECRQELAHKEYLFADQMGDSRYRDYSASDFTFD